jgi:hypothetical protein
MQNAKPSHLPDTKLFDFVHLKLDGSGGMRFTLGDPV